MTKLGGPLTFFYDQTCVPVAVAILEKCCMAFANMQWLFLPGERIVAHGPLVSVSLSNLIIFGGLSKLSVFVYVL